MSRPPETLTIEESEKLLTTLRNDGVAGFAAWKYLRNYAMALLMLDAGLRVGEVCRLSLSDLLTVSPSPDKTNELTYTPKTSLLLSKLIAEKKCERLVPLSIRLIKTTENLYSLIWSATRSDLQSPAFFAENSTIPLTTRQVQRIIASASILAFGRSIHPHVLRHTFATRLMRVTSTSVVQQLLGHKHINSTQVYMHANGDDCKKAIEKMNQPSS